MRRIIDGLSPLALLGIIVVLLAGIFWLKTINQQHKRLEIVVESRVKGVELAISPSKKAELDTFLNEIGFAKKNGVINIRDGSRITARRLRVILKENLVKPVYEIIDGEKNLWDAVEINYLKGGEVVISVFRRDWKEGHVNLLMNEALLRIGANTQKPFDKKLDDGEKKLINRIFFVVKRE